MEDQWSEAAAKEINACYNGVLKTLQLNKVRIDHAASALMALTATLVVQSDYTDDFLVDNFRKCLFDARTRNIEGISQ